MNEFEQELSSIQNYIEKHYQIETEIKLDYVDRKVLYIYTKKYDLELRITDKKEENYLNESYGLSLVYNANKKYRSELSYHGGGRLEKYTFGDYKIIDVFLEEFEISKIEENQMTIFDYEGVKE